MWFGRAGSGSECGVEELKWAVAGRLALILGPKESRCGVSAEGPPATLNVPVSLQSEWAYQGKVRSEAGSPRGQGLGLSRRDCIYHVYRTSRTGVTSQSLPRKLFTDVFLRSSSAWVATYGRLENGYRKADIHNSESPACT